MIKPAGVAGAAARVDGEQSPTIRELAIVSVNLMRILRSFGFTINFVASSLIFRRILYRPSNSPN